MPPHLRRGCAVRAAAILVAAVIGLPLQASVQRIPHGNDSPVYGNWFQPLPNGNVVVADPGYDVPGGAQNVGAVSLFASDGRLIQRTVGQQEGDALGWYGITLLSNGHYVVSSPQWGSPGMADRGAVTWGHAERGLPEVISPANSLVGDAAGNSVGFGGVLSLPNGHYVVLSRDWRGVGAATWSRGDGSTVGPVSAANSLVGSRTYDFSEEWTEVLPDSTVLLLLNQWDNGSTRNAGALVWLRGDGPTTGTIGPANALVGSTADDFRGAYLFPVPGGRVAFAAPYWDAPGKVDAGAVLVASGSSRRSGPLGEQNAWIGAAAGDLLGLGISHPDYRGIVPLANGELAVLSPTWGSRRGAVHRIPNAPEFVGVSSLDNAVVGRYADEYVGNGGVVPTPDGGLLVVSPEAWSQPSLRRSAGAITVVPPGFGRTVLAPSNSWFGIAAEDRWGSGGVLRLSDGRWLVGSGWIDHQGLVDAGGVGMVSGTAGTGGTIDAATLWFGNQANARFGEVDRFGRDPAWAALPNGEALVAVDTYRLSGATRAGVLHVRNDTPRGVLRPENVVAMPGTPVATLALANGRFAAVFSGGIAFDEGGRLPADVDTAPGRRWSPQTGDAFFRALALSNGRIAVLAGANGQDAAMTLSTLGPDQPTGTLGPTNSATNLRLCYPHLAELPGGRFTLFSASEFAMGCSLGSYVLASTSSRLLPGGRDWEVADGDIVSYDADYPPLPHFDAVAGRLTHGDRGSVVRMALDGGNRPPRWTRAPTVSPAGPGEWQVDAEAVDPDGETVGYRYTWTSNGTPIPGANGRVYRPTIRDRGAQLVVRVEATAGTDTIVDLAQGPFLPSNTAPVIGGLMVRGWPEPGQTLTAEASTFDAEGDPVALSFAWRRRDGSLVGTQPSYAVVEADGAGLEVRATASDGMDSSSQTINVAIQGRGPSANPDRFEVAGPLFDVPAPGVLGNDSDIGSLEDRRVRLLRIHDNSAGVVLRLERDGRLRGTSERNRSETVEFDYEVCNLSRCASATTSVRWPSTLAARNDRVRLVRNGVQASVFPLANDLIPDEAATRTVSVVSSTLPDRVAVDGESLRITPADVVDREDRIRYRICVPGGRCSEADVIVHYVSAETRYVGMGSTRGQREVVRLDSPDGIEAHVAAFAPATVEMATARLRTAAGDADPFRLAADQRLVRFHPLWRGQPGVAQRFHVTSETTYIVGIDDDGDGVADPEEQRCSGPEIRSDGTQSSIVEGGCEIDGLPHVGTARRFWVLAWKPFARHLSLSDSHDVTVLLHAVALEETPAASARRIETREASWVRSSIVLSWDQSDFPRLDLPLGYLRFRRDGGPDEWLAYRVSAAPRRQTPVAIAPGVPIVIPAESPIHADRSTHFIDVPPGARRLRLEASADAAFELRLIAADATAPGARSAVVEDGPGAARAVASTAGGPAGATIDIASPSAGRYFVLPTSAAMQLPLVRVVATIDANPPPFRAGSYFNPDRSGHGVFVYPASDQWVAIWYTYTVDGTSTWYYAQSAAPGANGIWRAPLYRSTWKSGRNHLAPAGHVTLTPTASDRATFVYTIDGITGSEPLVSFGRGCPNIDGRTEDRSGHWFDPNRSGTGYSVQLFPNYEFYVAFGYDSRGNADFRVAELARVGERSTTLPFEALRGFCPGCERLGDPTRRIAGSLTRRFEPDGRIRLEGVEAPGEAAGSTWTFNDVAIPLGGLQGCAP